MKLCLRWSTHRFRRKDLHLPAPSPACVALKDQMTLSWCSPVTFSSPEYTRNGQLYWNPAPLAFLSSVSTFTTWFRTHSYIVLSRYEDVSQAFTNYLPKNKTVSIKTKFMWLQMCSTVFIYLFILELQQIIQLFGKYFDNLLVDLSIKKSQNCPILASDMWMFSGFFATLWQQNKYLWLVDKTRHLRTSSRAFGNIDQHVFTILGQFTNQKINLLIERNHLRSNWQWKINLSRTPKCLCSFPSDSHVSLYCYMI